ncbi:MAG: hypothetical protein ACP5FT_02395 [Acidilobus sp.]
MPERFALITSRYLVYVSVAELVAALYVVTAGLSKYHARLMFESVLPTFIIAVGLAYASSSMRKSRGPEAAALQYTTSLAAWAVMATGLLAGLTGFSFPLAAALIIAGFSLALFTTASLRRLDVLLSVLTLGYTQALGGLILLTSKGLGLFNVALAFIGAEAVGAIFAVTLHSYPSTFGEKPSLPATALAFSLLTVSAVLAMEGSSLYVPLLGASMIASLPAFRVEKLKDFYGKAKASKSPVARGGTLYFFYGHQFAFSFLLADGALLLMTPLLRIDVLYLIHLVTLGVVMMFVLIHAPMMLPVIMGWSSARRYNLTPFVLQALGALLWPFNMHVSFFLIGLALVFDALIVKPAAEPMPLSLVR